MPQASRQSGRRKLKESQLAKPVRAWLCEQGLRVHYEVKLAAKRVDVVGVPAKAADAEPWTGVELKLYKWKDALAQATANAIVFDRNYVALWHESVAPALNARGAFEEAGVGLISVSESAVEVLIEAQAQRRLGQAASKASVRAKLGS